jgi:hypothetical protein
VFEGRSLDGIRIGTWIVGNEAPVPGVLSKHLGNTLRLRELRGIHAKGVGIRRKLENLAELTFNVPDQPVTGNRLLHHISVDLDGQVERLE